MSKYEVFKVIAIIISCILSVFALQLNCETNERINDQLQPSIHAYSLVNQSNNILTESILVGNQRESFTSYKSYLYPMFEVGSPEFKRSVWIMMHIYCGDSIPTHASKGLIETYTKESNLSSYNLLSENITRIAKNDGYNIFVLKHLFLSVEYRDTQNKLHNKYYDINADGNTEISNEHFDYVFSSANQSCVSLSNITVNCWDMWNIDSVKLWNWCKKYLQTGIY